MNTSRLLQRTSIVILSLTLVTVCGCRAGAFQRYRAAGLEHLRAGEFAAARGLFYEAYLMVPENVENLCDLAEAHVGKGRRYLVREDVRGASRELEFAVGYYNRAIQSFPGSARALQGKNVALELAGESAAALATARWASTMVGPSARQQIFLARELAERGDADQALLAYRQAVAMEPKNPVAHISIAEFYVDLNRREEAVAHLQTAYRLNPTRTDVAERLRQLGGMVPYMPIAQRHP